MEKSLNDIYWTLKGATPEHLYTHQHQLHKSTSEVHENISHSIPLYRENDGDTNIHLW